MNWHVLLNSWLVIFALCISLAIASIGLVRRKSPGAGGIVAISLLILFWSVVNLVSLSIHDLSTKLILEHLQQVSGALGATLLGFALVYTRPRQNNRRLFLLLAIEPLLMQFFSFTNVGGFVYRNIGLVADGSLTRLTYDVGPWVWVDITFGFIAYLLALFILTSHLLRTLNIYKMQVRIVIAGLLLPLLVSGLLLSGILQYTQNAVYLAVFSVTLLILAWGVFRRQLVNIMPFARDVLFESVNQGVVILDENFQVLDVNPAAANFLGGATSTVLGRVVTDIFPISWGELQRNARIKQKTFSFSVKEKGIDFILFFSAVTNHQGQRCGWMLVLHDNSENQRLQAALEESERKYRSVSDNAYDGIVILQDGKVKFCNRQLQKMTGYPEEEILNQDLVHFIRSDLADDLLTRYNNRLNGLVESRLEETVVLRKDGSHLEVEISSNRFLLEGQPAIVAFVRDITRRKRDEAVLVSLEKRYQNFVEQSLDGFLLIDESGIAIEWNKGLEEITGVNREETVGKPAVEILYLFISPHTQNKETHYRLLEGIDYTLNTGQLPVPDQMMETEIHRPDGKTIIIQMTVFPIKTERGYQIGSTVRDITGQRASENQLRTLSTAIEQSPVSVVITDRGGNIEYVNPRFCEVTGYQPEEVFGQNPRILKSGEMPPEEYKELWETISVGKQWKGLFHNRRKDGELYWEQATISGVTNDRGEITHYLAIKEDITARRLADLELASSRARLEAIYNNNQIGISLVNDNGQYLQVNQHWADMLAYSMDELLQKNNLDITYPDDRAAFNEAFLRYIRRETNLIHLEKRFIRKDGSLFWGEITGMPILSGGQRSDTTLSFIIDISERKAIEERLRASEALYRSIITVSPDNIIILNLDWTIRLASPVTLKMYAIQNVEDVLGHPIREFVHPEDLGKARHSMALILKENNPGVVEYRAIRRDGSIFYCEVNSEVLRTVQGRPDGIVLIVRDISDRKMLEADQKRRVQELDALRATMNDISAELEPGNLLGSVVDRVVTLLDSDQGELSLFLEEEQHLLEVVCTGFDENYTGVVLNMGEGAMGMAAQTLSTLVIENYGEWEGRSPKFKCENRTIIAVPLVSNQRLLGVLTIGADSQRRHFDTNDVRLVEMFAQQAAIAIQNARLFSEVQRLATTDSLTGVHTRRSFFEQFAQEFRRSQRYKSPLMLIMLDIDHFKKVNDNFGHSAGDEVLRLVARLLRENTRACDIVGRYGGEEFVILLPETELKDGRMIAQRLCEQVASMTIESMRGNVRATVSIGVAELNEETADLESLLEQADAAMYRAKRAGRNRISV